MKTKDHLLLGRFVLKYEGLALDSLRQRMFLWGCVEPDYNPFTYARGSLKHAFLRGHHTENARQHLARMTRRLKKTGVHTPLQWFRLGAALHYLADSFTFSHNCDFSGNLKEHRIYEALLHPVFNGYVREMLSPSHAEENQEPVACCHRRYLSDVRSFQTDCRYILNAALGLCRQLGLQPAPAGAPA